jgi:hypothetical protein
VEAEASMDAGQEAAVVEDAGAAGVEPPWVEQAQQDFAAEMGGAGHDDDLEGAPDFRGLLEEARAEEEREQQQQFDAAVDASVRERVGAFRQAQIDQRWGDLMEEFPELASDEGAAPVIRQVLTAAERLGHPEYAHDPRFSKLVYLAMKGEEWVARNRQQPAAKEEEAPAEPERDHLFQQLWKQQQNKGLRWDDG